MKLLDMHYQLRLSPFTQLYTYHLLLCLTVSVSLEYYTVQMHFRAHLNS